MSGRLHRIQAWKRGRQSEREAEAYLRALGWEIIRRNWRIRGGEIDLVARDRNTLVFVEVRSRAAGALVPAEWSISPAKLRFLFRSAREFLRREGALLGLYDWMREIRFDLVLFECGRNGKIEHIPAAFTHDASGARRGSLGFPR